MSDTTFKQLFIHCDSSSDDDPIENSLNCFEDVKMEDTVRSKLENSLETYAIATTTIERSRFRELLQAEIETQRFKKLNKKLEVKIKLLEERSEEIEKNYSVLQQREVKQQLKMLQVNKKNLDLETKNKLIEADFEELKQKNVILVDDSKVLLDEKNALEVEVTRLTTENTDFKEKIRKLEIEKKLVLSHKPSPEKPSKPESDDMLKALSSTLSPALSSEPPKLNLKTAHEISHLRSKNNQLSEKNAALTKQNEKLKKKQPISDVLRDKNMKIEQLVEQKDGLKRELAQIKAQSCLKDDKIMSFILKNRNYKKAVVSLVKRNKKCMDLSRLHRVRQVGRFNRVIGMKDKQEKRVFQEIQRYREVESGLSLKIGDLEKTVSEEKLLIVGLGDELKGQKAIVEEIGYQKTSLLAEIETMQQQIGILNKQIGDNFDVFEQEKKQMENDFLRKNMNFAGFGKLQGATGWLCKFVTEMAENGLKKAKHGQK